jgi:transcriptional regulator with XRE-family HTH domain
LNYCHKALSCPATGIGKTNDPICEQFGRNLRRLRSLAGLSRLEVGQRLGVTPQQVEKYESGQNNVSVATMCRLRIILGCEFADLLAGLGRIPPDNGTGGTVAYYKDLKHLDRYVDDMFDQIHNPGEKVTYSGIYRCVGCGKEISHNASVSLPPQNHHQHKPSGGAIRWQLLVWAVTHR